LAPALFQKAMDSILQGRVPNTICYIDGILLTGRSDKEHLKILRRYSANCEGNDSGSSGKIAFMQSGITGVEYL